MAEPGDLRPLARVLCERGKYDEYLPEPLLKEAFVTDRLDVAGAWERFGEMMTN